MTQLFELTARQAVDQLRRGTVTPSELIDAALARIEQTDGVLNALPIMCADRAREHADRLVHPDPDDTPRGYLYGLPIAIKDMKDVEGVLCTRGSPIFADHVSDTSDLLVTILESRGGVVLAKSNTPEFAAGANTFNEVFGKTRNPWNTDMTCGGSSGGSATALAAGQVWLASGSDLGGSLRIPASFCSVVGLRPTPGRVAHGPRSMPFGTLSVEGPMGRTVGDTALMLDAQAGAYREDPLSLPAPARSFVDWVDNPTTPRRIGFTPDLGLTAVDSEVAEICRSAMDHFRDIGAEVQEKSIDMGDAEWVFQTLRGASFVANYRTLLAEYRSELKPEVIWNVEHGLALSQDDVARAKLERGALINRTAEFFSEYDLLVCPTVLAPPFDVDVRYLTEVNGEQFDTYISWLIMTFALTLTGCPAISVPCGFTESGLPVGLQIMAPWKEEGYLLGASALFEDAAGLSKLVPLDPRTPEA